MIYGPKSSLWRWTRNSCATDSTTETYLGRPTLDELKRAVAGFKFGLPERTNVLGVVKTPNIPLEATTGIEPV